MSVGHKWRVREQSKAFWKRLRKKAGARCLKMEAATMVAASNIWAKPVALFIWRPWKLSW